MTPRIVLVVSGVMAVLVGGCGVVPVEEGAPSESLQQSLCESREMCNGVDDNCNGSVDEGCTCRRGSVVQCCGKRGTQTCGERGELAGVLSLCSVTPVTEVCNGIDDDCDGEVDEGVPMANCRVDADRDGAPASFAFVPVCPDYSRPGYCPAGYVAYAQYAYPDCDDTNASFSQSMSYGHDVDGDGHCTDAEWVTLCAGAPVPPGLTPNCSTTYDCDDNDVNKSKTLPVRQDADGDTHCTGPVVQMCSTATTPPPGFRFQNVNPHPFLERCNTTDDCNDNNMHAGPTCIMASGFTTTLAIKSCINSIATETFAVTPLTTCPIGFTLANFTALKTSGWGSCEATNSTTIRITCNSWENTACTIVGTCIALN